MRRRLVAMLFVLLPAAAGAQGASEAARVFLGAHSSNQWAEMARLVDSASLAVIRTEAIRTLRMMETVQSYQSTMPDTGAAAGLRRMLEGAKSMIGGNILEMTLANVRTEQEMNALSDLELMARWFEAKSPDYLRRKGMGALESMIPAEARSAAQEAMASTVMSMPRWDVVGEFREPDGAAHVVFRIAGKTPRASTGVLTFRQAQDRKWYLTFGNTDDQLSPFAAMVLRTMVPTLPVR